VTLQDTSGKDRAVTLVYSVPLPAADCRWLRDPRCSVSIAEGREYLDTTRYAAGTNGRMSRYPLGAVAGAEGGMALGIDMAQPAFFRVGFNAGTHELFLAYDIGLAPEKPLVCDSASSASTRHGVSAARSRGSTSCSPSNSPVAFRRRACGCPSPRSAT
jgi:hypothetical protein